MSFSPTQRTEFGAAVKALRETDAGKEATMYTARYRDGMGDRHAGDVFTALGAPASTCALD